jgi:hypothetical protein
MLRGGSTELDILVWMSRVSLELIGQAGIGISFDTLAETSPPSEYMLAAKQLMYFCFSTPSPLHGITDKRISPLSFPLQGFMRLIPSIVKIGSPRFRGFFAKIAPHPNIRKLREIIYFLYNTNKSIYQKRAHAITEAAENDVDEGTGQDIISVLSE